ncbi:MAG: DUF6505 family protein [Gammaproteobacteria bacterium]|jgi:hypothetical protein
MPSLLRIIQLDDSDQRVYDPPAQPGEWAVPGSFSFWDADPESMDGPELQAFAHGFLGTLSFGRGTLVQIAEISAEELEEVTRRLAAYLVEYHGAPDLEAALPAAREEIAFAESLCDHPRDTLLGVERTVEGLNMVESFKTIEAPSEIDHSQVRVWKAVEENAP